ncbi:hypothetical protein [Sulfobacillus harzensis]|uniref:Peptidase S24/S26A/S26B/S26C domain-containing protein n=1 Tax=Sulfobacillus harzensis TaxID=2729629 RepID=A0A7Y0L453_9FIRM|nr:hypothetical protein [Sulfobacillus harzensis]NMP22971.1 hypothetical protein [Sulfobacillus harzensis]
MQVIDQIANLILEDPLITASRIARRLGYAEEKTVYYWLHKFHYSGLNAFKKAVLHGQYVPNRPALGEAPGLYGRLPVTDRWTAEGKPIFDGDTLAVPSGAPAELIWRYPGPPMLSILPQDLLVLSAFDANFKSPWLVVHGPDGLMQLRLSVQTGSHRLVVHPITMERDAKSHPVYQILQLIRHY